MKKLFALVLSFCLFCGIAFAEGETPDNSNTGENKQGSLNLASLPERKTLNSLEDVLTAKDADRIQKAISDSLVSFAEKDDALSVEAWSEKVLQEKMENASRNRVTEIAQEIQDAIRETEEQNRSLAEAMKKGESKTLVLKLSKDDFSMVDTNGKLLFEPSEYTLMLGASSQDIRLQKTFELR